ncbi:hypothetical protein [Streptomyces hawaiiensis]|uniref:Uncharacterized protein n=1 Tax=Streptomyces hawaiiensis TaxID=67305 RepID=A0A6G5RMD1_9ACTN|nr:hypothetical protein [Streptomyces hawaiiensis]QCD58737.1 hypothetical protein CEB94_30760 [Streptomyces hawaiiensis]
MNNRSFRLLARSPDYPARLPTAWWSASAPLSLSAGSDDPAHAAARAGVITSIGYGGFVCGPPLIGALADRTEPTTWPPRPGGQTAR